MAGIAAALAAAAAGGALAHGSSGGATTVCVNDTNGNVRVAATCRTHEHAVVLGAGASYRIVSTTDTVAPNDKHEVVAACDPGEHVTGGGASAYDDDGSRALSSSYPKDASSWAGWTVTLHSGTITVYAVCAS